MPVPVLKLNLAPPPTLWRQHHQLLGWAALLGGAAALAAVCAISLFAYRDAIQAGREVVGRTEEAKDVVRKQLAIQARLQSVDVEKELPVWRLAERILSERGLPWSRLTAELERSLVQDVRLKSVQRTRNAAQAVELKLRGEARSRAAEEDFVASLQQNPFFTQVILERETDRQGGGVEFEYTLPVSATPPPFVSLPKYGPPRTTSAPAAPVPAKATPAPPVRPAARPAPVAVPTPTAPPPAVLAPPAPAQPIVRPPARFQPSAVDDSTAPPAGEARP